MQRLISLVSRFGRDERGAFAVIFGLMAIVLVALGGAVVDYVRLEQTRNRAQVALDAAALALHSEINIAGITDEQIRARAEALVMERVGTELPVTVKVDQILIDRKAGSITLAGSFTMPTLFVELVGVPEVGAAFTSQAVRGALDMEISVALDVTGSMSGTRITTLRDSMTAFINEVVQDDQTLNYTKVALIPYSQAVNAGSYATALRGPIRGPVSIKDIGWSTGSAKAITGATNKNPVVVTAKSHGFSNGDWVFIWGVSGMTDINNGAFQVANKTNDEFQLKGENGEKFKKYSKNGSVIKCLYERCMSLVTTSTPHGYNNGEYLHVTDVKGLTGMNNVSYQVSSATLTTLYLNGAPTSGAGTYTANTGQLHCTWQTPAEGCSYYRFQSPDGNWNTFAATTCVTERAVNGMTDLPPTASFVGRNYPPAGNPCLTSPIVPLTSNKPALRAAVAALKDGGSTSGSLGALWSWYMLAPNFGYVWPFESQPAPYRKENLLKTAIFMTDGEFNTVHCNGVVARNSTSGSGGTSDHISCVAPNGDPYVQARAYCDAMKDSSRSITIYTVAFDIAAGSPADQLMKYCASGPDYALSAANDADLRNAFEQIARRLSALRIAH